MLKESLLDGLRKYSERFPELSAEEAQIMLKNIGDVFRNALSRDGIDKRTITRFTTKFRDAGRRSAPWKPTSSRVPGRPQDGKDGNRINRWLLPKDHKFYASEENACFVEAKYMLQTLSMKSAPKLLNEELFALEPLQDNLVEHLIRPGEYLDPIMLETIDFQEVKNDLREIQSGHLNPLDRGGIHIYKNTFLMRYRSNQLQGNLKVSELIQLLKTVVNRHSHSGGLLSKRIVNQD